MIAQKPAEALEVLAPAIATDPENRELRILMLQVASLVKRWDVAAAQVPRLTPLADSEPVAMFFAAVALFETKQLEPARQLMERALPRVTKSPYVDYYGKRVLAPLPD